LAVGVPGAFKGYSDIYKLYGGGVSWESLFEPTIKLCEDGIKISKHLEISLKDDVELIKNDPMLRYDILREYSFYIFIYQIIYIFFFIHELNYMHCEEYIKIFKHILMYL